MSPVKALVALVAPLYLPDVGDTHAPQHHAYTVHASSVSVGVDVKLLLMSDGIFADHDRLGCVLLQCVSGVVCGGMDTHG